MKVKIGQHNTVLSCYDSEGFAVCSWRLYFQNKCNFLYFNPILAPGADLAFFLMGAGFYPLG
jgi:hypothetical protein